MTWNMFAVTVTTFFAVIIGRNILTCGDIEPNPGPPKYPCGECRKACSSYRGAKASILCDTCGTWFHADCVDLSPGMLAILGGSDLPWECHICGCPKPSSSLFDSMSECSVDSINSDSYPDHHNNSPPNGSNPGSSVDRHQKLSNRNPANFRVLVVNFQSVMSKRCELACVIDTVKPDIIIGCETWLRPTINHSEFLPADYTVYRKDRSDRYGGVLLAVHSSLNSHAVEVSTDAELVAAKILAGKQSLVVCSFYRPPNNDSSSYMDALTEAITMLSKSDPKAALWLAGDANLPDIDWSNDHVRHHQYSHQISDSFLQVLARTGLEQVVDFPTRKDNTLDIVLTNRPSLVTRC